MKTKEGLIRELRKHAQGIDQLADILEKGHMNEIGALGTVHMMTENLEKEVTEIVKAIFSQPPLFPM